jgi:hypothetical protein
MSKRARLADFKRRVGDSPDDVRTLGEHGRFVTVNPMSDEHELLKQLDLDPQSCLKVDLYWEYAGDVAFVEIQSTRYAGGRAPGTYVRQAPQGHLNVVIVVPDAAISSSCVMQNLHGIADEIAKLSPEALEPTLTLLER